MSRSGRLLMRIGVEAMARELRSWLLLVPVIVAAFVGLSLRPASPAAETLRTEAATSAEPRASESPTTEMAVDGPDLPLTGAIVPPSRPSSTSGEPTASPTAAAVVVASQPTAAAAASAPAAPAPAAPEPTPTPVPVPDPNPVIMTESRVSGPLGSTLSQEGYSVTVRPKATPSSSQCTEYEGYAVYELVVVYTTPFSMPHFDADTSCMDGHAFPLISGATYEVFVERSPGSPIQVSINPNDGSHTLIFAFD